ncbi:hypothetical protein, unlikely [Trypanosoma brucei gambiense DAL972]|uniref:Uncharacterized protein n=1 Tax=Trypanosoma brucei gambiense (strain MHOM/CI/86/DAL972) TaxID=679716 RepID=C9ZWI0_TRYB9|nr:hypothetical protein, unlikely [Trypanosoma brucei gambiense DAL972]CBH13769.1 hypothetical protein, unlikely [Trypanosoma brucei gambiense DAL972]|eukprot:XP_011776045.1 hypothetical protein, unlikely [Trypanosoma brucei gambiense DAL972]
MSGVARVARHEHPAGDTTRGDVGDGTALVPNLAPKLLRCPDFPTKGVERVVFVRYKHGHNVATQLNTLEVCLKGTSPHGLRCPALKVLHEDGCFPTGDPIRFLRKLERGRMWKCSPVYPFLFVQRA